MSRILSMVASLMWMLSASPAVAADRLVVGVEDTQYYPHFDLRDGVWVGFAATLLQAFASQHNYELDIRPMPKNRLHRQFLAGEVDLRYPDSPDWHIQSSKVGKKVYFSVPVSAYTEGVSRLKGVESERLRSVGVLRGTDFTALGERLSGVRILQNDSFSGLMRQVLIGRIDGVYTNIDVVCYYQRQISEVPGALVYDPSLPHHNGYYHLSSISRSDVVGLFDRWMSGNEKQIEATRQLFFASVAR